MTMNEMQLAQLKRQVEWHETELKHALATLNSDELALENAKKKVADSKKKVEELKHQVEQRKQEVMRGIEEIRRNRTR